MIEKSHNKVKYFFLKILNGALIGVALITPGFSGGTVAVVLGIYDGLLGAITGLFKNFKKSFMYLLPLLIGMLVAVVALIKPIELGLKYIPLSIICLFVGLMLGGTPAVAEKADIKKPKFCYILAAFVACAFAVGICFIPGISNFNADNASFPTYATLIGVGILAAAGFVVPGISGSMIAMIFGVYNSIIDAASNLLAFNNVGGSILTLLFFGIGVIIGFFLMSFLMKALLKKFPRGSYFAILGFILGSIFSIFYTQKMLINPEIMPIIQIILGVVLFCGGLVASLLFLIRARKKQTELLTENDVPPEMSENKD